MFDTEVESVIILLEFLRESSDLVTADLVELSGRLLEELMDTMGDCVLDGAAEL